MPVPYDLPWQRDLLAAEGYLELGLLERAGQTLNDVPERYKARTEFLALRLTLLSANKAWSEASLVATQLLEQHPEEPAWWISCAYATRRSLGIPLAEKLLRQALPLHPREGLIYYNLACYCAQTERCDDARELLYEAFDLQPSLRHVADQDPDLEPLEGRFLL